MCGISGFYSINTPFSEKDLRKMSSVLSHRGPDAEGYFTEHSVGLGHKRLSIIDISENANQPMFSLNNRYVIIYNGETYNYKELISLLDKSTSQQLKTTSDTEIILELFSEQGTKFVEHLNGMFAMAIYDREKKELYLFRDRMGIKPLFYYWDGNNFAFASEIKSLLQLNQIDKTINASSIRAFLHLGYIPAPFTAYRFIFKMESGSMLRVSSEGLKKEQYWSIAGKLSDEVIHDELIATNKLEKLITDSVSIQMRSDVPLGVFLSGGIDSGLITAVAASVSTQKLNTFSIGFNEASHDESGYAKKIAQHLNTDHHEFMISYKEAIPVVADVLQMYDEPYADSSAIPTLLLSQLTRKYVKVALSGDGADELFHGYGFYNWANRLNHPLVKFTRIPVSFFLSFMSERSKRASTLFSYPNDRHLRSHIFSQEQYLFSEQEIDRLLKPEFSKNVDNKMIDMVNDEFWNAKSDSQNKTRSFDVAEKQSFFDIQYYLQDDLLTKIDRATMRHSLEVRVPYLDHRIVEFAINLSPGLKMRNGTQKYILKKVLARHLPEDLFNRPKQGFSVPLASWLKNELKYLIEDNLSEKVIREAGILDYPTVKKYIHDFYQGRYFYSSRLWSLIVLHAWLRSNKTA